MNRETLEEKLMEAERQLAAGARLIPLQEALRSWRKRLAEMEAEREPRTNAPEEGPEEC